MIVVAIKLSDHFTYGRLVRFALPSIAMMIFTSIYSVVDGLFVSNFAGKEALAAVNLVFPLAMALGSIGFMLGTGGAALVAKTMGEGDAERANRLFSFITIAAAVAGAVLIAVGAAALEPVLLLLGAQGSLLEQGLLYGRILLVALPLFIVQNVFLSFFIAAEKPQVGFAVTVAAGVTNIVLDYLFIAVLGWGIAGAAVATAAGQALAAAVSVAFFARSKTSRLRFMRPAVDFRALGTACVNGSSELMTEVAASVVSMLYNYQLMMLAGADGVAAYGVIMYVNFIFTAVFFGFSMGTGPVVSYHYGAQNRTELKGLFRKSFILVGTTGAAMFAASQLLAAPLVSVFVGYDPELAAMTLHGFRIYAVAFLVCGFNIRLGVLHGAQQRQGIGAHQLHAHARVRNVHGHAAAHRVGHRRGVERHHRGGGVRARADDVLPGVPAQTLRLRVGFACPSPYLAEARGAAASDSRWRSSSRSACRGRPRP